MESRVPTLQNLLIKAVAKSLVALDGNGLLVPTTSKALQIPTDIAQQVLYELRASRTLTIEVFQLFNSIPLVDLTLMMEFTNAPPPLGAAGEGEFASSSLRASGQSHGALALRSSLGGAGQLTAATQARVSDDWLDIIAEHHPEVLYLDISKGYRLTDAGLSRFLPRMQNLRSLNLTKCKRLTDKAFRSILRGFTNLHDLSLGATSATAETVLEEVCPHLSLISLDLSSLQLNDASVIQITLTQTRLQSLVIKACTGLTEASLQHLSRLTTLVSLDISFTGMTPESFKAVESLTNLQHLSAAFNARLDSSISPSLRHLVSLTSLDLSSTETANLACEALATLTNLLHLWLDRTWITPAGVAALVSLPLETLHLAWNVLSDESLSSIALITSLQSLKVSYCSGVSDRGVAHLSSLNQLTHLEVGTALSALTADSFPTLQQLTNLRSLSLCETRIAESELTELASKLPHLAPRDNRMNKAGTFPSYIFRSYGPFSAI